MIPWTTWAKDIRILDYDLTDYEVWVTVSQQTPYNPSVEVDLYGSDLSVSLDGDDTIVSFVLSQEQTGRFVKGKGCVQVNAINAAENRKATGTISFDVGRNTLNRAIRYEGGE